MYCRKCGTQVSDEQNFCRSCGEKINKYSSINSATVATRNTTAEFRPICLIAIIACALLWLFAPFVAVNILTLENQPTALQFFTDDIPYIGDLPDAEYWASVISLICIVVCFVCALLKKHLITRIAAIVAEVPMILSFIHIFEWANGKVEHMLEIAGFGFWGMLIGFLVIIIDSRTRKAV